MTSRCIASPFLVLALALPFAGCQKAADAATPPNDPAGNSAGDPAAGSSAESRNEEFLALGIGYSFAPPLDNIVCSGQMKPEQFDKLKAAGIERVICLRDSKEKGTGWEEERAAAAGIEFIRMPISGKTGITKDSANELSKKLDPAVRTLVACGSSNRVGALFALRAQIGGATPEESLALGKACGLTRLEPVVKQALGMQ